MKTDKLFYRIFLSNPQLIAELLPGIPTGCQFTYSAPVVKETELRLDGVLTPISGEPSVPLVFLEAQMQSDTGFYGRYFAEIFLDLQQYAIERPWRGLLIIKSRSLDLGSDIPYQTLLEEQVHRLYLKDLIPRKDLSPNVMLLKLLVVNQKKAGEIGKQVLKSAPTKEEFAQRLDLVESILVNRFPQLSTEEILKMLDLKSVDVTQTRFYQEALQQGQQQGRQQGHQEGLQQGRQEEASALVLRLLTRRLGVLDASLQARVRALSIEQLEALGEALLDFTSLAELEVWLADWGAVGI